MVTFWWLDKLAAENRAGVFLPQPPHIFFMSGTATATGTGIAAWTVTASHAGVKRPRFYDAGAARCCTT